jgi:hypothetical protein
MNSVNYISEYLKMFDQRKNREWAWNTGCISQIYALCFESTDRSSNSSVAVIEEIDSRRPD